MRKQVVRRGSKAWGIIAGLLLGLAMLAVLVALYWLAMG